MRDFEGKTLVTLAKLSELTGWTKRWINRLTQERGLPHPVVRGEYDLKEFIHWMRADADRRIEAEHEKTKTLNESQERIAQYDADMKEIKLQEMRRELLPRKDVSFWLNRVMSIVRQRVLGVANKAAPEIRDGMTLSERKEIIEKHNYEALSELANTDLTGIRNNVDDAGGDENIITSAKTDYKPVGRRKPKAKRRVKRGTRAVVHVKGGVPAGNDGCGERSDDNAGDLNDKLTSGENRNFE